MTANTTNVTDSPCCPAEFVFTVILLVFIVVPSTLAADTSRYSAAKVQKKYNWGQTPIVLFLVKANH